MAAYLSDNASIFFKMSSPNSCRSPMRANSENSPQMNGGKDRLLNLEAWVSCCLYAPTEATHFNSMAMGVGRRLISMVVRHGWVAGSGKYSA